ncbi:MAG TPA: flagellar FliJ family protein [Stellaceae bacterium]|jgi:flagellar FliJ protein|nr:flagellar FliJ family protein [Stellaceae bacterium]
MSALDQLIRLHRWRLDELRRHLSDVEALATKLEEQRRRLDSENTREQSVAGASPEAAFAYPAYARQLIERRRKLAQSQSEALEQIAKARAALGEAFQEVKRYETAAASRLRQQQRREQARQQQALDEIGIDRFRRRGRESR